MPTAVSSWALYTLRVRVSHKMRQKRRHSISKPAMLAMPAAVTTSAFPTVGGWVSLRRDESSVALSTACNAGLVRGCYNLGVSYDRGQGVAKDARKAASLYQQACQGGHAGSCYNLGDLHLKGQGVARDIRKAVLLFQRACDAGFALGCSNLGLFYTKGEGLAQDASKAAYLFQQACNAGEALGCYNLANLYMKGEGLVRDAGKAASLFQRACEAGDTDSCHNLGSLYFSGEGVAQDATKAALLHQQACQGGHADSCYNLGISYARGEGVVREATKAASLYQLACDWGQVSGCYNLGLLYDTGEGVAKDAAKAVLLYRQACNAGHAAGCNNLGVSYKEGKDTSQGATAVFERADPATERPTGSSSVRATIVEDAKASAEWIASALSSSGYRADFTLASLSEIDRFFDEHSRDGQPVAGGLLSESTGSRLFALGSYVGEVIRRNAGGEWVGDDSDPKAEINIEFHLPSGVIAWPVQRAMKRLINGSEDGIAPYGEAAMEKATGQ